MLPAALLLYRIQGDRLVPALLGEADHPWLRALIDERERFVGRPRRELAARLTEPLPVAAPPRRAAMAAHVLDGLAAAERRDSQLARRLRAELFAAAAAADRPRDEVVGEVARQFALTADAVERALFADLPGEQRLGPLRQPIAPAELAARTNLALVRALIARADRVLIDLEGHALRVIRRAKLRGLIVTVTRGAAGGAELEVSGPVALFHHTRLYGRALGELLPLLAWCRRFALVASCTVPEGTFQLRLATGDPLFPADEPAPHDSQVEARFAAAMRRATDEWELVRDPQPFVAGDALVFPDYALVHRLAPARRWLIEIVGYWTPDYLARKLAAYRAAQLPNLVLCIDDQRRCADGDLPPGARVVWYRRHVNPGAVLAAIEAAGAAGSAPADVPTESLLEAIRAVASRSSFGNAFVPLIERRLARPVALDELIGLCRAGHVALNRPTRDLAVRPLDPPRPPLSSTPDIVRAAIAGAIEATRRGSRPPLYHLVREHFDWLGHDGEDHLRSTIDQLAREDVIVLLPEGRRLRIERGTAT